MDVGGWLRNLGLGQYETTFHENAVDAEVLPALTADDLKDLGITLVGHRRRLLEAIAALRPEPASVADPGQNPGPEAANPPATDEAPGSTGERRQVCVMFCDVVGFTALSSRLDPEDLGALIRGYQSRVAETITRFDGFIARYVGDGVLIYFGWPEAHEANAERAVRAALAVIEAVRRSPVRTEPLQVRIGIATGLVVVGEPIGAGDARQQTAVGKTPNLAARLQGLAEPNGIVIDAETQRQIGGLFICRDLGTVVLKGLPEAVHAWQVVEQAAVGSRFEALRSSRIVPLIGRDEEFKLLLRNWQHAAEGEGQLVLLSGEAGIGKSRLVLALCERLAQAAHKPICLQCSPFHTTSTLYPVLRYLEHAAGLLPDDLREQKLYKLEALLKQAVVNPTERLAALAPLFVLSDNNIQQSGDLFAQHPSMMLTLEQHETRAVNALAEHVLSLAADTPVLFVLEDAHWSDPVTLTFLNQLLLRLAGTRLLMLITHRPEFQPDWVDHPQVTTLALNRLSRGQAGELAREAAGGTVPEAIVAEVLRRADGVPLFIEELTRSAMELDSIKSTEQVPETLQDSLLGRLDRLGGKIKEIALIGSVIGREFGIDLLCAATGRSREALDPMLRQLVSAQIVLPASSVQGGTYLFRHTLIRDAAYQSLLLSRRRQYHADMAHLLESRFPEITESQPELVAQHYKLAGVPEQAIAYCVKAGKRALARSTYMEPIAHFEEALQLARSLPEGPARTRAILDLQLLLGETKVRTVVEGAAPVFAEAANLARTVGSPADLARAAIGLEQSEVYRDVPVGDSAALLEAALVALPECDDALRCRVLSHLGRALFRTGAMDRACLMLREATSLAHRLGDSRTLYDALECGHIATAGQPWPARTFPERRKALADMLAAAKEIDDHPELILVADAYASSAFLEMGDLEAFEECLAGYRNLGQEIRFLGPVEYTLNSTEALRAILHGDFVEGERLAQHALQSAATVDDSVATGVYGIQMFTIRREQGRLGEVAPVIKRFVARNPRSAAWRPGLALIASDLGFEPAARKMFNEMAIDGFAFPVDAKRNITLCYLAETCVRLGDADRAEQLYDLLLPYQDNAVVVPVATVCCGANARYLGMLASIIGDWAAAEMHFESALAMDQRLQAWPWLAHTKYEFALALHTRNRTGDRTRMRTLLAEAAASAERFGLRHLERQIASIRL